MRKNPRPFIEQAAITKADQLLALHEVKSHPHGGWTHAIRQTPGGIALYYGSYGTKRIATKALDNKRSAVIAALMRGVPASEIPGLTPVLAP